MYYMIYNILFYKNSYTQHQSKHSKVFLCQFYHFIKKSEGVLEINKLKNE